MTSLPIFSTTDREKEQPEPFPSHLTSTTTGKKSTADRIGIDRRREARQREGRKKGREEREEGSRSEERERRRREKMGMK